MLCTPIVLGLKWLLQNSRIFFLSLSHTTFNSKKGEERRSRKIGKERGRKKIRQEEEEVGKRRRRE